MNKIKSFFQRSAQPSSREAAKQRLQLVLVHDRNQIEPGMLELIKDEIIAVISKHLDIDRAWRAGQFHRGRARKPVWWRTFRCRPNGRPASDTCTARCLEFWIYD